MVNHTAYGARMGDYQAWQSCDIVLAPEGLAADGSTAPLDIQLDYWDVVTRANRFVSAKAAVDIRANGRRLALVTADFTNHSAAVYRRIRGPYADLERALANAVPLAPPLAPSLVARQRYHDVVLSATDSRTRHQLRVDLTHPGLFDHPVDHAPGMLLLEAVRQAAYTGLGTEEADLVRLKCSFNRYSELDSPCWLQSARLPDTADGHACFSISAVQEGRSVLSAVVELRPRTSR
jgi:hypothetical protein